MTTKPAQAPSEEALEFARINGPDVVCEITLAELLDAFAAQRLSAALLDPSEEVVEAADRAYWAMPDMHTDAMRAALRAVAMKITEQ